MPHLITTLACLGLFWAVCCAWFRWRYITETWPLDLGWRRLDDLKQHEPRRGWLVYHVDYRRGRITLIGLRKPLRSTPGGSQSGPTR